MFIRRTSSIPESIAVGIYCGVFIPLSPKEAATPEMLPGYERIVAKPPGHGEYVFMQ
jgi:hypothetical protein